MTTLEILRSARKLLSNPKRWTKHTYHKKNEDGESCYCAIGAIWAAAGYDFEKLGDPLAVEPLAGDDRERLVVAAYRAVDAFSLNTGISSVPSWNDNPATTYEDVMAAFSKACEVEFEKQQEAVA